MKKILIPMGFLLMTLTTYGQAEESTDPQIQKEAVKKTAAKIELPYSPQVVTAALDKYTQARGGSDVKAASYTPSHNVLYVMNNKMKGNLHFYVKLKKITDPNLTELYLNLSTSNTTTYDERERYQLTMEEAITYLDNLAIVIKPFAQEEQLKLQSNELLKCKQKTAMLEREAEELQKDLNRLQQKYAEQSSAAKKAQLTKKIDALNKRIEQNKSSLDMHKYQAEKEQNCINKLVAKMKD